MNPALLTPSKSGGRVTIADPVTGDKTPVTVGELRDAWNEHGQLIHLIYSLKKNTLFSIEDLLMQPAKFSEISEIITIPTGN